MVDARLRSLRSRRARGALTLLGLLGCAAARPDAMAPPRSPAASVPVPRALTPSVETRGVFEGGFRTVYATGQGLEFPLPDAAGWRHDPRQRQSWVARHLGTASTLIVRAWRHDDVARVEECEQQARLSRPDLPSPAPAEVIEERRQEIAGGYASRVTLFVRAPERGGQALSGHALAFGSDARDCLLLAFSTSASGRAADLEIARRLGAIVQAVFGRARRLGIDQRVPELRL